MNNNFISLSEAKKLGATCLARRNENGQLEAIISFDNAPTVPLPEWKEITEESIHNLKDHYYYLVAHKDYGTPMKAKYHCDYPQFEIMSVHDKSFGVCLLEEPCHITHYMELPSLPWEK